jgi:hypothetical protein
MTTTLSRRWHLGVVAICAASLVLQFYLSAANKNTLKVDYSAAKRIANYFSYFTIESNIIVLCVAVSLVLGADRDGPVWRVFRFIAVLCITVTCLVDVTVLRPQQHLAGASNIADLGLHIVTPVLFVLGWVLFGPRPRFDWGTLGYATVFPIAWLVYTLIRGPIAKWYPYPFIDVITHGYARVTVNVVFVAALIIGLGAVLVLLDRKLRAAPMVPDPAAA